MRQLAVRQFGAIGRCQALALGLTAPAIAYRVHSGEWRRALPKVYIVTAVPPSWEQRLKVAELWAGDSAVVSHRAAARIWKLDGVETGGVELLTPGARSQAPPGVILHRTRAIARRDWASYRGFRVTGLARTLYDLASVVDPATFEAAAESGIRLDSALYGAIVARLDELGGHGRAGAGLVREFLAGRDPNAAATESVLETRFLRLIRAAGLPEPVRQYVVWMPTEDGDRFVIRLDFAHPPLRFGIRLNGKTTHLQPEQWQKDQTQGNDLQILAWTVLDFTWEDVRDRPEQVLAQVLQGYERATRLSSGS